MPCFRGRRSTKSWRIDSSDWRTPPQEGTDDLHVAPFRDDGVTYHTPTWIWSVAVGDAAYLRGYNGQKSRWYQAGLKQKVGRIIAAGMTKEVTFEAVDGPINNSIDDADTAKYHTSGRRSLAGTSLAAETDGRAAGESRLKAGCSQDWPPHKVLRNQHPGRRFLESPYLSPTGARARSATIKVMARGSNALSVDKQREATAMEVNRGNQEMRLPALRKRTTGVFHGHGPRRSAIRRGRSRTCSRSERHIRTGRANGLAYASLRKERLSMSQKKISSGVVHEAPADLKKI